MKAQRNHLRIAIASSLALALLALVLLMLGLETDATFVVKAAPQIRPLQATYSANCTDGVGDVSDLIADINAGNANPGPDIIILGTGCVYTLTTADNYWYGPNGLPAITSTITIEGQGATIVRASSAPEFRLFYVGDAPTNIPTGTLTLRNLTLKGGLAKGGNGGGGGGMGAGGAIFNQGRLHLEGVTASENTAQGGNGGGSGGGGGIGANGSSAGGGGGFNLNFPASDYGGGFLSADEGGGRGFDVFGTGGLSSVGGDGATGSDDYGGGGGGFTANASGANGGGASSLGGDGNSGGGLGGDGGGGGADAGSAWRAGGGGGFGGGGGEGSGGGGGGVGGGGGAGYGGGGGGFGGGGGSGCEIDGGDGGFGGGGGGESCIGGGSGSGGGFGGGGGDDGGGGGGGMGGAIFNHAGWITLTNTTLAHNAARGGNGHSSNSGGTGYGGGIFNLDGLVTLLNTTVTSNTVVSGSGGSPAAPTGGAIYNRGQDTAATITAKNTILADTSGGDDCAQSVNSGTSVVNSQGHNLVESGCGTDFGQTGDITGQDPKLAPLADNGGDTTTMALLIGSPAIDTGSNIGCPAIDQRGIIRPQDGDDDGTATCDIGAYERTSNIVKRVSTPSTPSMEELATADPGDPITYTISFVNVTVFTYTHVVITDIVPISVMVTSVVSNVGPLGSGGITDTGASPGYVWRVRDLAPREGGVITITGILTTSLLPAQIFTNTAHVSYLSNSVLRTTTTDAAVAMHGADLAVSKRVNDPLVYPGDTIVYTVRVLNKGPDDTTWVEIDDALPSGVTYVSSNATQGAYNPGTGKWYVGGLLVGTDAILTLSAQVNLDTPGETRITNTAVISVSDQADSITGNNVADAVIEVAHADLAVSKTSTPDPVIAGERLTYTLIITNHGPAASQSAVLTDVLPGDASFVSASPGCNGTTTPTVICTVGVLESQATISFTIIVTAPVSGGPITNTVTVAGSAPDLDPFNDMATESTWVSEEADLAVGKRDSVDPVVAGDLLTYTIVVTNHGPDWAAGVVLTDVLPAGVVYAGPMMSLHLDEDTGATTFGDSSGFGHHSTCITVTTCPTAGVGGRYDQGIQLDGSDDYLSLPDLPSHDELTVGLWVKIPGLPSSLRSLIHHDGWSTGDIHLHLLPDGRLEFALSGNAPLDVYSTFAFDSATFNQWTHLAYVYDTEQKQVSFYVNGALDVVRSLTTAITGNLGPGQIGNWDDGPRGFEGAMDEVVIYDRALAELEVAALYQNDFGDPRLAASQGTCTINGGLTCNLGVMPPGAVATVTLPVRVSSAQTDTLTNTAHVGGYVPDPASGNDDDAQSTQVEMQADLGAGKRVAPDPGLVLNPITYTVTVTNFGPSDAHNVLLTDTLQGALTWGAVTPSQGSCGSESGGTFTCTLGTIGGSYRAHVTLVVTPSVAGRLTNTVQVSGDEFDPLTDNDTFIHTVDIGEIDLALTKSANPTYLSAGDDVTYTLHLVNNGPVAASSVTVSDTLPSGINVAGSGASHGSYASPVWDVGNLAAGEVATLTITGTVGADTAAQLLVNTAVLSGSMPLDIITRNNSASVDIQVAGADLALGKTVDDDKPDEGSTVVYQVQVTNLGPDDTTGVVVSDTLPLGVTYVSSSTTQGAYDPASGAWTVGALGASLSASLRISATVDAGAPGTSLVFTNTAVISTSAQPDSLSANNADDAAISVTFLDIFSLTVHIVGDGSVTRTPSQTTYVSGTLVTLEGIPDPGWFFDTWSGDLTIDDNPVGLMMDSEKVVTAIFTTLPPENDIYLPLVVRNNQLSRNWSCPFLAYR